jgi:hypothetical protein
MGFPGPERLATEKHLHLTSRSSPRICCKGETVTAAFCLANWMNYALGVRGGPLQWRFPLGYQLLFKVSKSGWEYCTALCNPSLSILSQ